MIRDPGPIHNLGFSVTSRDIPLNEGETEGDAPNSGYVARALNDHPIMRFLAVSAATIAGTVVASKVTKKGGLKLSKFIQDKADNAAQLGEATFSTSIVKSVTDIRRHLDELQGVSRYIEGVEDPYSKIVFEQEAKHGKFLTTGYEGAIDERRGFGFLTSQEKRDAGSNFLSKEPPAVWTFRDELQQRLVRAGRRLPYELPAMYGVQKAIVDPLMGERDESKRKIKWYNPVDVVADFTKTSLTNIATMVLPFEFAGAAASTGRSSLHTLRYSMNDMRRITPYHRAAQRGVRDLSDLLSEVGQDFATLTDKFLKTSAQASGGLASAADAYRNQGEFVQNLYSLRHGVKAAREAEIQKYGAKANLLKPTFKSIFGGTIGEDGTQYKSIFELSSAFKGMPAAFQAGKENYRLLGKAYDAMESSVAYNRVISTMTKVPNADKALKDGIHRIQSQHSSRLTSFASGMRILGQGGPGTESFKRSDFYIGQQQSAFKDLLEQQLISSGVDKKQAELFVSHAKLPRRVRLSTDPTKILTIGKTEIIPSGTTSEEVTQDFFSEVLKRYSGIKHGKAFNEVITPHALQRSVENTRDIFASAEFQKTLQGKISSQWNTMYRKDLLTIGEGILKPKKAQFQDFLQPNTYAKQDFLRRKTAQTLGIKLLDEDGFIKTDQLINNELAKRGFDPSNFTDLRAFLIKNRQMTSGVVGGKYNIFGLQALTVSEAMESGRFAHLRPEEQNAIKALAARRTFEDPTSNLLTTSKLPGVYKTRSGNVLDFTAVKSTVSRASNFLASELRIPILGFNPADLFGYRSFAEMSRRSSVQYISSRSVQPFLEETQSRPDFFIFSKSKGTKGRLIGFTEDADGSLSSETLRGTYRSLPTASADLLTRHARVASGEEGLTPEQIRGTTNNNFLNKLLGEERALRYKRAMSIDTEQPNSLIAAAKRFKDRKKDLDNNPVIAGRLRSGELNTENIDADFLRAYNALRKQSFRYGMPQQVMKELEDLHPQLFKALGKGASEISSPTAAIGFAEEILKSIPSMARKVRVAGADPSPLYTSASRIQSLLAETDLNSISAMSQYSPTITSRLDQLRNEIFKYIAQSNQITRAPNSNDMFIYMVQAIDDLKKRGVISAAQRTEAQAAGLSALFNFSAFKTFTDNKNVLESAKAAVVKFGEMRTGAESLLDPFTEGTISQISGTVRRRFSPILGPINKRFGSAGFSPDDLSIDPLGSGQQSTLVPTFGTVFGRDPFAAISSALGFTTYSNPLAFSTGSIPVSQGVERLNRYFGSLGMQLDVSDFKGPLDLFARGMVGKRVLPLYAAGTAALTVDRTLGGMVNEKDERGERVYSPLVLGQVAKGAMELQSLGAGITPGGMSYQEKREQLVEGEVPIRQGRFWPLGNQPFRGGKVMYYRPSWYQRLQGGAMFTSDTYGSPAEKFLFYNDISPLRPIDPYRFERKHYQDRPYPVTGEYFSGPFGPIVPLANATIGRLLKPQLMMHEQEVAEGLAGYAPAGEFGAYDTAAYARQGQFTGGSGVGISGFPSGGFSERFSGIQAGSVIGAQNAELASRAGATNMAQGMVRSDISSVNSQYISAAQFGPPKVSGVMNPRIVPSGEPLASGSTQFQLSELGYRTQEMLGIYGFAFGSLRQGLGFGQSDFEPQRAVLQSAAKAYSSSRAFWDLNLGGLGDVPLPSQEAVGNIEFSEIIRRFIPKERSGVDYLNPIRNTMGMEYPFLPGPEYYIDFTRGDPFTKVQEGEIRLPGVGYERFNRLYSDETGRYGLINQLDILGDVAPYSQQYRMINSQINKMNLSAEEKIKVKEIRDQVESVTTKFEFKEYKYRDSSAEDMGMRPSIHAAARLGEMAAHSDNFVLNKIFGQRTAVEDWERRNVYGATFPEWQRPFDSYIAPMLNKATQDNPVMAAASLGIVGGMFGRTPRAKLLGSAIGVASGAVASTFGQISELITGDRFIPDERKKEIALEEYSDIMNYVKNVNLANQAKAEGDGKAATQYTAAAGRTMYGMDLSKLRSPNQNLDMISLAIPKRKREHFKAMINAPEQDRERILSTAGRLERRLYQAAWGMKVEERPELVDYFSRHELPDASWEGWLPNTNIDHVKIKMGQSMGLEMSQMGYYPQQIKEANLANPSYPSFSLRQDKDDVRDRLRGLMTSMGIRGSVTPVMNPFGSQQINVSAGVN